MLTTTVDNFPGFPEGIQGPELMQKMRAQAERFGAIFLQSDAKEILIDEKPYEVKVDDKLYKANSLIIATGAITKWLEVPGEDKLRGRGVSSCAPCDAPFFKDKKVIVIGGGDSSMEEALVLTKYATSVTIIHRRDAFRASEAMQKKVLENNKIKVFYNTEVKQFLGEDKLEKVKLLNNKTNEESELETDGAFVAIGHVPATSLFKGKLELDEKGYLIRPSHKEGVFISGDVHDYIYRQAITAAGYGCEAAMDCLKYLDKDTPSW